MRGKKFQRGLAGLPASSVIQARDHKTARLTEIVRGIAVTSQGEEARVFYPVRQVARHFRVPISTVARVYAQLEDEGLLTTIRGSKTLLQGLSSGRHFSVRGFIGMPAALSSFVTIQDVRGFFIRTRRELRTQGFAVATIFFEPRDLKSGRLADRINKYNVDTVVWYCPDTLARETIAQLVDTGIKTVCIRDNSISTVIHRYEVRRDSAISKILRDWKQTNGTAVIVRGSHVSATKEEMLVSLVEEEGLKCEFRSAGTRELGDFLESLADEKRRGIIFPSQAAALFAFRTPEKFAELMMRTRVCLTRGGVAIPFTSIPDEARVDIVLVDWQLVAEKVASDLISKRAFDRREITVFEASAALRTSLSQYAQVL